MAQAFTFGLDISHHQDARLDLAQCHREGIDFVVLKATEGSTFVDSEFAANLAEARAAGLLVAAYHYQRPATVAEQIANILHTVPRDVPVILDVESGSGDIALTRMLVTALQVYGYHVPLTYLPRWYWQQIGSPSLAGLPPLWSSRYPDTVVGSLADEWADVPAHYWTGYGGLNVAVLQFTSSVRIAGHQPIDANAYRGTREQLAVLLGVATPKEEHVKNLILARERGGPRVYVGDGLTRRHVADEAELTGLQWWIEQKGGDPTVHEFDDLRVLGDEYLPAEPLPVELTDQHIAAVVDQLAAKLGALQFVANPERS